MGFYTDLIEGLKGSIGEGRRFKTNAELARFCEVAPVQTSRYINGQREKHLQALGNILDKLGARLVWESNFAPSGHELPATADVPAAEKEKLVQRIAELEAQVEALKVYKNKWEGHLETVRAQHEHLGERKFSA